MPQPTPVTKLSDIKLAIIGLGYVGLPLAAEFAKRRDVVGFDINATRVEALKQGTDTTLEVSNEELKEAKGLVYTTEPRRSCQMQRLHRDGAHADRRA